MSVHGDDGVKSPSRSEQSMADDDSYEQGSPMPKDASPKPMSAHSRDSLTRSEAADGRIQNVAIPSASVLTPVPALRADPALPSSSLPLPEPPVVVLVPNSSLPLANASTAPPSLPRSQKTFVRKVTDQGLRDRSIHPDISAPGRILVPNSDTSYSQHTQSQSQSQSQSLPRDSQSQIQPSQRF